MKRKLTAKEYTYVASMLFGLFFGAGNLIFPVHLGQMAGSNVWQAILGLLITGVGLPLLGVAATYLVLVMLFSALLAKFERRLAQSVVHVKVGSVEHPMLPEHYIEWVSLQTKQGNQRKELHPGEKPEVCFALCEGDEVEAVYAYCNLHSLWKA